MKSSLFSLASFGKVSLITGLFVLNACGFGRKSDGSSTTLKGSSLSSAKTKSANPSVAAPIPNEEFPPGGVLAGPDGIPVTNPPPSVPPTNPIPPASSSSSSSSSSSPPPASYVTPDPDANLTYNHNTIIPDNRLYDWKPGVTVGVIGGIPNRTIECANLVTLGCHLQANASSCIANAINACPEGQVVKAPAGTYKIGSTIYLPSKSNVTLRGDGIGKTIFKVTIPGVYNDATTGDAKFVFKNGQASHWSAINIPIISGATKGRTSIKVGDASPHKVGSFIIIAPQLFPSYTKPFNKSWGSLAITAVRITSISTSDNTIEFFPKLPMDWTGLDPKFYAMPDKVITGMGYENLTVDTTSSNVGAAFRAEAMYGGWLKNIEVVGSYKNYTDWYLVNNSEIRGSIFHGQRRTGPDTEGVDLRSLANFNLIEDNIVEAGGIFINDGGAGCMGNVIAYNLAIKARWDGRISIMDIGMNHGHGPMYNIVEGNLTGKIHADNYFGSTSHGTIFRNWATSRSGNRVENLQAIRLGHYSPYFTVVGNVLGVSEFGLNPVTKTSVPAYYEPYIYDYEAGWTNGAQAIFNIGYPNMGNGGFDAKQELPYIPGVVVDYSREPTGSGSQYIDRNVAGTMVRHGNYQYAAPKNPTDPAIGIVWDPKISGRDIPASLLYGNTPPSWWTPGLAWPPFGPDKAPSEDALPAAVRYKAMGRSIW